MVRNSEHFSVARYLAHDTTVVLEVEELADTAVGEIVRRLEEVVNEQQVE